MPNWFIHINGVQPVLVSAKCMRQRIESQRRYVGSSGRAKTRRGCRQRRWSLWNRSWERRAVFCRSRTPCSLEREQGGPAIVRAGHRIWDQRQRINRRRGGSRRLHHNGRLASIVQTGHARPTPARSIVARRRRVRGI
jgi:hypothetical protein